MGNLLENIKEVREEIDGLFSGMDINGVMNEEEKAAAESIERKLAEIDKEVGVFFSGQI